MDEQPNSTYSLEDLRRKIAQEIRPLVSQLPTPLDRYRAYESLLRDGWSDEIAYKAFEEAKQIKNTEDKFYSLQSLSNDIYFHEQDLKQSPQPNESQVID